ncbi:hypothetical protein QQF64_020980 [Cirrhinus molitorella]|uniref:Uncharacterized protein n=1 Tax=Cirrhinus molitorella TaxID=172907 RepID=A0ABR3LC58_9TELE
MLSMLGYGRCGRKVGGKRHCGPEKNQMRLTLLRSPSAPVAQEVMKDTVISKIVLDTQSEFLIPEDLHM